jgi:hypothetical protein
MPDFFAYVLTVFRRAACVRDTVNDIALMFVNDGIASPIASSALSILPARFISIATTSIRRLEAHAKQERFIAGVHRHRGREHIAVGLRWFRDG